MITFNFHAAAVTNIKYKITFEQDGLGKTGILSLYFPKGGNMHIWIKLKWEGNAYNLSPRHTPTHLNKFRSTCDGLLRLEN
jgi:hypothetical protein